MKKLAKRSRSETPVQLAALPYRTGKDGTVEVLLITSRGPGRWLIPKGWPMEGKEPHEAAATEAYEEAGALGDTGKTCIGRYASRKRLKSGDIDCQVDVYPLEVSRLKEKWPERAERARKWFKAKKAAALVEEPGLESLILSVSTGQR